MSVLYGIYIQNHTKTCATNKCMYSKYMFLLLQYATVLQLDHLIVGIFIKLVGFNFMHSFDIKPMRL